MKDEKVVYLRQRVSRTDVATSHGWAGLTSEEAQRPGAGLLAMLYMKANEDGLLLKQLAFELGVTYGYIHQLKTGMRDIRQVSDEFIEASSRFLNKPKLYVAALADKLSLADFMEPASLESEVDTAIQVMYKDPQHGGFMPLSLRNLGLKERLFIVRLYEAATGKRLVNRYDPIEVIE